ncbi:iron-sulfur cluster biosynthesis family protein [Liquorilactobacillus sicerae]|uniref:iron-sulfur cluster biosynthesis family protein n=1 Tax=Liquorilactobacillus sicerae TaxID=1416943 RepID=UPI00248015D0|nr:iron-sulfur cluster biosynthesis family protein [Liquorilactobacillus sicerae]
MYLTVTPAAQAKIKAHLDPGKQQQLLLDFDDGVGQFSRVGTCALTSGFRVLIAAADLDLHDYNQPLPANFMTFLIKDYSLIYLDETMKLDVNPKNQQLKLTGDDAGVITSAVVLETATIA